MQDLLLSIRELLTERLADDDKMKIDMTVGADYNQVLITQEPMFSKTYWATVRCGQDGVVINFSMYDAISSYSWDNRNSSLTLQYYEPECLEWIVRSLRRYFSLCWGNHLKPWEVTPGGCDV